MEIVRSFVTVWIVILLTISTLALQQSSADGSPEARPPVVLVAVRFVAAQGVVDLILEAMQLTGLINLGRWRDYLTLDNLIDLLSAVLPSYLCIDATCRPVTVFTIFVYWARVLGIASLCAWASP